MCVGPLYKLSSSLQYEKKQQQRQQLMFANGYEIQTLIGYYCLLKVNYNNCIAFKLIFLDLYYYDMTNNYYMGIY